MADLYSRSKIFLLLSESEGFGLPPLEAMGAGCVPVCRDAGGPQSYMLDSLGDLLLPLSMSIQDICLKLLVILNDPVALQNYSDTSRRIFQQGETRALNRAETVRLLMIDNGISEK
jgi:glycosyltransferase involved in cell wall biosynthesis